MKTLDNQFGGSIGTVADQIIESILEKHSHFFELYKDTRNAMPGYFNNINELIMSKIQSLQELSNSIMTLEPEHYELLKKTNEELSKIYSSPELQNNFKIEQDPIVKESMNDIIGKISQNLNDTINNSKQYAKTLQNETNNMINTASTTMKPKQNIVTNANTASTTMKPKQNIVTNANTTSTPIEPQQDIVTNANTESTPEEDVDSVFAKGGFVRSGTRFPKKNYKIQKFPLK